MSEWVDCEMSHGPRKRGRVCLSCEALKRVPVLRDRIADLKRQIAEAKRERDEARADNGRLCMLQRDHQSSEVERIRAASEREREAALQREDHLLRCMKVIEAEAGLGARSSALGARAKEAIAENSEQKLCPPSPVADELSSLRSELTALRRVYEAAKEFEAEWGRHILKWNPVSPLLRNLREALAEAERIKI